MKFIVPLILTAYVSATASSTSGSSGDGKEHELMNHPTLARQLRANTTRIMSGFVTMTFGTDTACTPVTGVVRVQLGVCAQQGNSNTDDYYVIDRKYVMNYVEQTGINAQLMQKQYNDSACSNLIHRPLGYYALYVPGVGNVDYVSYSVVSFVVGCGLVALDSDFFSKAAATFYYGENDDLGRPTYDTGMPGLGLYLKSSDHPKYATVTFDAGFNALPAASSASGTWKALSVYAHGDACAQPATNTPVFFSATPVAVMDTCTANVACTDIRADWQRFAGWGATWTEGCVTVAPKTSGYMMVTQWTGGDPQQCTGSIADVPSVTALGQCFAGTAKAGFSPAGETTAYYRYNAVTQTATMASAMVLPAIAASGLQLTEYSDAACTAPVATEIVASFPFVGCSNGVQVKTLPMSPYIINPCFYFRQVGLLISTTVAPALPLVPGIWNVTSFYTTAAGCTDTSRTTRPLSCSAKPAGTAPGQTCKAQACSVLPDAQKDPLGLQVGRTCLDAHYAKTKSPTSAPTLAPTRSPTRAPTSKGKVAAAVEAVGAALGRLRGGAAV